MKHTKQIQTLLALAGEFPIRKRVDYDKNEDRVFCNQVLRAVKESAPILRAMPTPSLELVHEFNYVYGHPIPDTPTLHDHATNKLRVSLIEEEFGELKEALEAGDPVQVYDALLDIQYVLDGAFLALGFHRAKDAGMAEVHRSNMTKLVDGKPARRADGKIIKGPNYEPPKLRELLSTIYGMFQPTRNEAATPAEDLPMICPNPNTPAEPAQGTGQSSHTPGATPETVGNGAAPGDTPDTANTPGDAAATRSDGNERKPRKGASSKGSGRNPSNQPHAPQAGQPRTTGRTGRA